MSEKCKECGGVGSVPTAIGGLEIADRFCTTCNGTGMVPETHHLPDETHQLNTPASDNDRRVAIAKHLHGMGGKLVYLDPDEFDFLQPEQNAPYLNEADAIIAADPATAQLATLQKENEKLREALTDAYNYGVAAGILKDKADNCYDDAMKADYLERMAHYQRSFKDLEKQALSKGER